MKIVAVYLTGVSPSQPAVAAFPGPRTEELERQIAEFVARNYPGRSYELRDQDVETLDKSKLQ